MHPLIGLVVFAVVGAYVASVIWDEWRRRDAEREWYWSGDQ